LSKLGNLQRVKSLVTMNLIYCLVSIYKLPLPLRERGGGEGE
jgi:hypothetical protein